MKHFTLSIVISLISSLAFASTSNSILQDSIIVTDINGLTTAKYIYNFDEKGNKLNETTYRWDDAVQSWKVYSRLERKYDQNDNLERELDCVWNAVSQKWEFVSLDVNQYDIRANKTLNIQYVWNNVIEAWVENFKNEMAYDAENNQINLKHFVWDAENEWIASTNSTYKGTDNDSPVYNFAIYNKVSCLCE